MDCDRLVSSGIPPFDEVWEDVNNEDDWRYKIEDKHEELLNDEGIEEDDEKQKDRVDELKKDAEMEVKKAARFVYDDIVDVLSAFHEKETMIVYRAMSVDLDDFLKSIREHGKSKFEGRLRGVGIYWSYDIKHAVGHWAHHGGEPVILVATIKCDDVDFYSTILAYMNNSASGDECANENEITLAPGREIFLDYVLIVHGRKKIPMNRLRIFT